MPEKPDGPAVPTANNRSMPCGMRREKNSPNCFVISKSAMENPIADGSTVQISDALAPLRVPSYMSQVHLPTLAVPPAFLYSGRAAAAMPAMPRPAPCIIASMRARCSGGRFCICACICAIAPDICAERRSTSAFVISEYVFAPSSIIRMTCAPASKIMICFRPVGPVISVRMRVFSIWVSVVAVLLPLVIFCAIRMPSAADAGAPARPAAAIAIATIFASLIRPSPAVYNTRMPIGTAVHARTFALAESLNYREWSGYYAVSAYEAHHEHEYNAIRNASALIDVSPLFKYRVSGRDAG